MRGQRAPVDVSALLGPSPDLGSVCHLGAPHSPADCPSIMVAGGRAAQIRMLRSQLMQLHQQSPDSESGEPRPGGNLALPATPLTMRFNRRAHYRDRLLAGAEESPARDVVPRPVRRRSRRGGEGAYLQAFDRAPAGGDARIAEDGGGRTVGVLPPPARFSASPA